MSITIKRELKKRLSKEEYALLLSLDSPQKIQDHLDRLPFNHEEHGETNMTLLDIFKEKKAHCFEGALVAYAALTVHSYKPFLISLYVTDEDYDHCITVFKKGEYYGALSKTNHSVLTFRDPAYSTLRELAMSYFHEYFLINNGKKTMRAYSKPFYLTQYTPTWIDGESDLLYIAYAIKDHARYVVHPHISHMTLRNATSLERLGASTPRDGIA
ncbi:MAG: hypothetical protein RI935_124 [Candidatus Parcubacteria bacterium]|jgi:hypothetical protein